MCQSESLKKRGGLPKKISLRGIKIRTGWSIVTISGKAIRQALKRRSVSHVHLQKTTDGRLKTIKDYFLPFA
jgi:hypothetical protein